MIFNNNHINNNHNGNNNDRGGGNSGHRPNGNNQDRYDYDYDGHGIPDANGTSTSLSETNGPDDAFVNGEAYQLTTERLAYILIGSCCALSILCLIIVAFSIRCRDMCDEFSLGEGDETGATRIHRLAKRSRAEYQFQVLSFSLSSYLFYRFIKESVNFLCFSLLLSGIGSTDSTYHEMRFTPESDVRTFKYQRAKTSLWSKHTFCNHRIIFL